MTSRSNNPTPLCPKCEKVPLVSAAGRASRLLRCPYCRGTWFPRDEAHLDAVHELLQADDTIRPGSVADARTGLCPLGHGILIRAKVEIEDPFYLERCPECVGIWFDKGEWNKLAQSHLLDRLDTLWDPAWRFRHRQSRERELARRRLEKVLGPETLTELDALVERLGNASTAVRSEALAYLEEKLGLRRGD
ncbi:MAG: zf-TFIIB domain-containing protein [Deltaproteobacteria bacterium]|nr:zf-TFIIB domain-containing protein [Deltaproteobacteria bacterium]